MTPETFIAKWQQASLKERSAAQEHFIDLCRMLGEPTPAEADPKGDWYAFEYGAKKAGGGDGWADVWKRGCFGWEYKGKGKDLQAAFKQLQLYAPALQYPPLLIVCDLDSIIIHTALTNAVQETHVIPIVELGKPEQRAKLKWAFAEPERLRPGRTRSEVTAEASGALASLAETLRQRGREPHAVAHFLTQCLFCLYAEDASLLPAKLFERIVEKSAKAPDRLGTRLGELFQTMRQGGEFLLEDIAWFNGGLFQHSDPVPLEASDIDLLLAAARMDWSAIEPAIFGTLFERGLDPAKRSQLGAHYTDPGTIRRLIDATIANPLRAEWAAVKQRIEEQLAKAEDTQAKSSATKARAAAEQHFHGHLERLRRFQVLDPACGSGNFLYLALQTLKDLEADRVPGGADLVTYWFEKARAQIEQGKAQRAGLVATNSIRGGANRKALERIRDSGRIFQAWSDEPWINEGAAVRVSLVAFDGGGEGAVLDDRDVGEIYADLSAVTTVDITLAVRLPENADTCFMGASKKGPFDIPGETARRWLTRPNPNGRPNSEVLHPP